MEDWRHLIPDEDKRLYELAGFGHDVGFGARPAILVIDVQYRTTGSKRVPIIESLKEYPTSCGSVAWDAVDRIQKVLDVARHKSVPVIYTCVAPKRQQDLGRFGDINPLVGTIDERGYYFVAEIAPHESDLVVPKRHASAFFGTALVSYLIDMQIDTLIVTGCTTSGCVRATVADAFSFNFRTIVVEDAVYDRIQISHVVSLFDIDSKYADVVPHAAVTEYLETVQRWEPRYAKS